MFRYCLLIVICIYVFIAGQAFAEDLIYRPINPSFGGNPLNSSHLMGTAEAQRKQEKFELEEKSAAEQFVSMLQSRLYSSLASAVSEAIFGENAQENGTITFDDQQVSFVNTGTEIRLTLTDFSTGQVTNITVPTLVSN